MTRRAGAILNRQRPIGNDVMGRREGFTLIELILVVALIVVIASLSAPAVTRLMQTSSLDKGAEMLRSEMARARVMAIKTGKVHALLLAPGGSQMNIRDFESMASEGTSSLSMRNATVASRTNWGEGLLPPGVVFVSGETAETNRSRFITSGTVADSGDNRPILFYPDGTCQDAQVTLQNQKGNRKQVTLRGLTGTSRVSNPG